MSENSNNPVNPALEFAKEFYRPDVMTIGTLDGEPVSVLTRPRGVAAESLEEYLAPYRKNPLRRKGTSSHVTLESLILHTNRFKDTNSVLFANGDMQSPRLLTVFDYNEEVCEGQSALPRFGEHRAEYIFPLSDEWKAWIGQNGKPMDQGEFGEFLEDRIIDIAPPLTDADEGGDAIKELVATIGGKLADAATLIELAKGFKLHVGETVKQAVNLSSGEVEIHYEQTHQNADGQKISVPNCFLIAIPCFKLGHPYTIAARLRYRKQSGSVVWFYNLFQIERVFEHAYSEACEKARVETALPLFHGAPEGKS